MAVMLALMGLTGGNVQSPPQEHGDDEQPTERRGLRRPPSSLNAPGEGYEEVLQWVAGSGGRPEITGDCFPAKICLSFFVKPRSRESQSASVFIHNRTLTAAARSASSRGNKPSRAEPNRAAETPVTYCRSMGAFECHTTREIKLSLPAGASRTSGRCPLPLFTVHHSGSVRYGSVL
ncbi:unnamed protein product [Pleuronectes platessa]|uniref:Uncharacterized protein n=1 Tax=Pleuronectes platessa TaxID=8262 RepID=A0A9N7UGW9_PLEPL|nr:unnamed protein product [Pleuronectes platessa]